MAFDIGAFASEITDQLKIGSPKQAAGTLIKNVQLARDKQKANSGNIPAPQSPAVEATPYTEERKAENSSIFSGQNLLLIGVVIAGGLVIANFFKK